MAKYLYNATVKTSTNFYKNFFTSDMIFTKDDAYNRYDQVEMLNRGFNAYYIPCIGSLIDLLSTRVDLIFPVHKLAKFSSNPGKVNFEVLVHLLRYIRENKILVLNYYANIKYVPLSDLLRQDSNKTANQLMAFSHSSWQDFPDTVRSTGAYIIFYQGGPIDHGTHVPVLVAQSST